MLGLLSRHVRICSPSLHNPLCHSVPSYLPSFADTVSQHCFRCVDSHSRQDLPSFSIHANQLSHCSIHNNCTVAYYITLHSFSLHYITAAVGRAHIAPTQTIATPCGPALPLFPLRRKVQSLDTVSFQRMRCLPGRRRPRGSQWRKRRGKPVWCIRVTCTKLACPVAYYTYSQGIDATNKISAIQLGSTQRLKLFWYSPILSCISSWC